MLKFALRLSSFVVVAVLVSCQTTPRGSVPTIEAEQKLGEKTRPAFLDARGGLYSNQQTARYLRELTKKLSASAAIPEEYKPIPIRVLDTKVPSAYTLPGGSIYVSRGIISMANDESQLAGVIAHEIGHVMARHVAEGIAQNERLIDDIIRQNQTRLRATGSRSKVIKFVEKEIEARLGDITSFSRSQELEADRLAIQILENAGYRTAGFGELLERLEKWQRRQAKRMGVSSIEMQELTRRSGYPAIEDRVAALGVLNDTPINVAAQERLMELIDGMKFDDRFQGGFIREGVYWHPTHRFSFNVPSQFIAGHGVSMKLASSDGLLVMRVRNGDAPDFDKLVDSTKSADTPFKNPKRGEVNGIATVSVSISDEFQGDEYFGEVTFFDLDDQYVALSYFAKRKDTSAMRPVYDEVISSFKRTQFGDAPGRREFKARKVQGGESVRSIAGAARFDGDGEAELRLWNGLGDGEAAAIGDWIKYVE